MRNKKYNKRVRVNDTTVVITKITAMENNINLTYTTNPYLKQFYVAQNNFNQLIKEERLNKRMQKSKRQLLRPQ